MKKHVLATTVWVAFGLSACGGTEGSTTFEEVIAVGQEIESFPASRTQEVVEESEPTAEDYERTENNQTIRERFVCTRKKVSVLDGSGSFPLFNTSADVIYPGSLLQGKTLSDATPSPIVVKRAGGTVSYDLINGNLEPSFGVEEVTKSSITSAMNNIIAQSTGAVPANFQLDIIQIESKEQLALELGIDVSTFTTKVSADLSFSAEQEFNRSLVRLKQSYYTMSFDLPTSLEEVFDPSVTPEQLSTYVQADNPATFISSVTYGRIFYMLIESTSSRQEMSAKLNVAYGAFSNSAEGSLGVEAMRELKDLKIKVIAYGGDAETTFQLTGETTLQELANRLGQSTDIRVGLPLSYVVRSVERPDQIVGTRLATEYDVVDCELRGVLPPAGLRSLVDLFKTDTEEGGIGAMAEIAGSNALVFSKKGDRYAWYNADTGEVKGMFNVDDTDSPLGAMAIDGVGAAFQQRGGQLYLFDTSGLNTLVFNFNRDDPALAGTGDAPVAPIGSYQEYQAGDLIHPVNAIYGDSPDFPFAFSGFEAGVRVGGTLIAIFAQPGDKYGIYSYGGTGSWRVDSYESKDWFVGKEHAGPDMFENVGAAAYIVIGGMTGRYLLVNEAGNEIFEYISRSDTDRELNGPWVIN